jgi:Na+/H+ antiporter NhaD/arsenite permease-like protein
MIRRAKLNSRDRIAAWMLSVACVILGTFGFVLGMLNRVWSASLAAVFVLALGIIYARAAIVGRSLEWPWR